MMKLRLCQFTQPVGEGERLLEVAKGEFAPQLQLTFHHQRLPVGDEAHQFAQLLLAHLGGIGAARFTLLAGQFGHGTLLVYR